MSKNCTESEKACDWYSKSGDDESSPTTSILNIKNIIYFQK